MSIRELFLGPSASTKANHPEAFQPQSVDPSKRTRTVPMQVLSLRLSRTGTASMYTALTMLGYETYHGFRAFADVRDYDLWNPAYETKYFQQPSPQCPKVDRAFFDKVLGHMEAVTDMPPASFALELIAAYPEAKVVLVKRDETAWYRSFENIFIKAYDSRLNRWISWLDPSTAGRLNRCLVRGVALGQFGATNTEEFRRSAIPTYRKHNESIKLFLKDRGEENRLIDFNLKDGWQPLCAFIGKEVPVGSAFPRINETKMTQEKIAVMLMMSARRGAAKSAVVVLSLLVLMIAWWSLRTKT